MPKIRVHEKALAHLSRGLYRSPASAIRELVSNAWDANATVVRVDTGAPTFTQLSVQDNGVGFTQAEFARLMGGGIGNSEKRPQGLTLINKRPTIGRLGIGMLGIAQICGGFTVTSKTKDGKGFRAHVQLFDLIKERLDRDDKEVVESGVGNDDRAVLVGKYDIDRDFDSTGHEVGTTIATNDLNPTFVQSFRSFYQDLPRKWESVLAHAAKEKTLQQMGDYWRLVWELAASCPVPYLTERALPEGLVSEDQRRLLSFGFKVLVDGLALRKPVSLHGNPEGYTCRTVGPETIQVFGRELTFHGYIVVQEGRQLKPDELRGVLIRIKEIGVGLYDGTLLDYRINEGPRSRWLTAEIFVDTGLEDALNIDRDSFNRFHPQFRALQQRVHELLQEHVFPSVYRNIDKRSKSREDARSKQRKEVFAKVVDAVEDPPLVRTASKRTSAKALDTSTIQGHGKRVTLSLIDPTSLPTKKAYRPLASAIISLFDLSMRETSIAARRRVFTERLLALLSKW